MEKKNNNYKVENKHNVNVQNKTAVKSFAEQIENVQQDFMYGEGKDTKENITDIAKSVSSQWKFEANWRCQLTKEYFEAKQNGDQERMKELQQEIMFFDQHRKAFTELAKEAALIRSLDIQEQKSSLKDRIAEIVLDLDIPAHSYALLLQRISELDI